MMAGMPTVRAWALEETEETNSAELELLDDGVGGQYGTKSALSIGIGSTSIHGNSLSSTATNYGYALVDKSTSEILKFGETIHPQTRYSQSYLNTNNATLNVLESGSKADIHMWQYDMNSYYKNVYGIFPPLNKRGW